MEYVIEVIKFGLMVIVIKMCEGVVLVVEKCVMLLLMDVLLLEKIVEIDVYVGCVVSGLTADAWTMVEYGRAEC